MNETRRRALKSVLYTTAGLSLSPQLASAVRALPRSLTFGIITDVHIGFIKDAPERFAAFEKAMRTLRPDGVIQMGDFAYPQERHQRQTGTQPQRRRARLSRWPGQRLANLQRDRRDLRQVRQLFLPDRQIQVRFADGLKVKLLSSTSGLPQTNPPLNAKIENGTLSYTTRNGVSDTFVLTVR